jgi:regulator of protease activity HflC (stomatin/prohibitin superfamily)
MRNAIILGITCALLSGCAYQTIEPGHRGLRFDPHGGGLGHETMQPGIHNLGWCFVRDCGRIDDFDTTYSTRRETISTTSSEGLAMDVHLAIIYRPVMTELYELDSETGLNYYDEVIGPEFKSAARGVFARHAYGELMIKNDKIEDEVEAEVRRRTQGKHVEIASITMEGADYAPEITNAIRQKLVTEQETQRQKAQMEADAQRKKTQLETDAMAARMKEETEASQKRMAAQHEAEQMRFKTDLELETKKHQVALATQQLELDKLDAKSRAIKSKAESDEIIQLAHAHAEENRAKAILGPLDVQMAGYEALGKLGGNGTTVYLGDWSRTPQFLFPRMPFTPYGFSPAPVATSDYTHTSATTIIPK